jgi:ABC-type transport system involved in multi-copper enzyme maturation permease subunit
MGETSTTVGRRRWLRRESNPLLVKELRGRMRGARAFIVLTVYLLLLSCFTSIIYYTYAVNSSGPGGGPDMSGLGKTIFSSVVLIEIFLVTFITPAFTSGAISGERERRTFEVLRTTLLSARKLVSGKLASALTYMLLLVLAAVPMESLAFVLGGVVVEELGLALLILMVTAFAFAVLGLFYSSFSRTTLVSTVLTYATALIITIGLPVLLLIFAAALLDPIMYGYGSYDPSWVVEAMVMYLTFFFISLSPISAAIATEVILLEEDALFFWMYTIDSRHDIPILSPWISFTLIYLGMALLMLLITVLRVRRQATK